MKKFCFFGLIALIGAATAVRADTGKDVLVVNEVGNEQSLYFSQLFEAEKMLGWVKDGQRIHIKHGLYRFKDEKMSTRKGNTIWLEDVLKEAEKKAFDLQFQIDSGITDDKKTKVQRGVLPFKGGKEEILSISKKVAIGAIKWNDLKRNSNLDIVFDWDEVLNMQGDSGPYIQYVFARTQSVLAKIKSEISDFKPGRDEKLEKEEASLLRALIRFSGIIEQAGEKYAPNILCNYLFDLAQKFNISV